MLFSEFVRARSEPSRNAERLCGSRKHLVDRGNPRLLLIHTKWNFADTRSDLVNTRSEFIRRAFSLQATLISSPPSRISRTPDRSSSPPSRISRTPDRSSSPPGSISMDPGRDRSTRDLDADRDHVARPQADLDAARDRVDPGSRIMSSWASRTPPRRRPRGHRPRRRPFLSSSTPASASSVGVQARPPRRSRPAGQKPSDPAPAPYPVHRRLRGSHTSTYSNGMFKAPFVARSAEVLLPE